MSVEYTNDQLLKMVQYLQQIRDMSQGPNGTKIAAALAEGVGAAQREDTTSHGMIRHVSQETNNLTDATFKELASSGESLKIVVAEVIKNLGELGLSLESIEHQFGPAASGNPVRQNKGKMETKAVPSAAPVVAPVAAPVAAPKPASAPTTTPASSTSSSTVSAKPIATTAATRTAATTPSPVELTAAQRAEVEKIIAAALGPLGLKFVTEKDRDIDSIGVYKHDSKTVGVNFKKAVETYAKYRFTKYDRDRETAEYQQGDVISSKSPRNYGNYEDVIQYILSIVSHEVAHATQFKSVDYADQLPTAAVELSTIQLEQAVFKKLFPDRKAPIRQPLGSFRVSRGFSHDPSDKMQPFASTILQGGVPFVDSMRLDEAGIKQLLGEIQVVAAGRRSTPRETKVIEHLRKQLAEFAAGRDPYKDRPLYVGQYTPYAGPSAIPPERTLPPRTTTSATSSGSPYDPIPIRATTPVAPPAALTSTTSVVAPRPASAVTTRRAPAVTTRRAPVVASRPVEESVISEVQPYLVRAASVAEDLRAKNIFPHNTDFDIKPEEVSSEMEKSARNLLKSAGTVITAAGDKTGSAYRTVGRKGSLAMVLRAVEDLYHRTAVKTGRGEEYLSSLADVEINSLNLPSIIKVIQQAITTTKKQGLRSSSEVLQSGYGTPLHAGSAGVLTAEDIGKAAADDSDEGTPRSMVRNNSVVYYKEDKTSTYRGQQALRTAMGMTGFGGSTSKGREAAAMSDNGRETLTGSQVVGFGTKDVFPPLVVDRVKARIEEQERIARAQLAAGETTSMQVGTTTYDNVPRIIADSQLAIMRSAGRASEITGLTKLGNKHGPYGELEGNHSIDMLANLHLGKMFQSLTTTGEIPTDLTENFLLSTAAQESDPSVLPASVKPEQEANNLQVMAQRLKEKLAYYQRVGEENLAANADQSPSQLAMEEISSLAMQQRLLDELMTTAANPDEEKLRRQRRGQIIYPKEHQANLREPNSHIIPELSSDEALLALFGDSVLTAEYPATFLNIREQGQSVKDYIHSTGGNTQATRSYDKFGSVARAVKAATASDSRDADELYNSIIPEDYQAQLDSSGTSKAKMLDGKEVDVSHTSGMVEKDISYILNDMYGLSAQKDHNIFNAMYHAGRATDEQGNLLDPAQLRASMGGTTKHGLESIHRGAQDLQDISRTGIPLVEYAKLRTQEVLPGQEEAHQQALDRIHAVSPALAELNDSQVQALSKIDYKQEASQVLTQIIKTVGTSIQKRVAEAIQKKGRAAGYSDDQLVDMFVDNKETGRAPAGFESLFRQFNLFNPATIESNPEFLRAMTLLMDVQTEAARGETAADFTARALGTTTTVQGARTAAQMQSANLPHAIEREGYGLQASARTFIQDETGRAPRAIVKRQILGAANLEKLQQELKEAMAKKDQVQQQYDNASSTRKGLLGVELRKAIDAQEEANRAFLDAAHSADPTAVDVHFSKLSAIVASDAASPESRQAAMIELAASERIRAITRENPLLMRENVDELDERDMTILPGQTSYLGPESGYEGRSQVERLRSLEEHLRLVNAAKTAHPSSDAHQELALFESERNFRIANYQSRDEAQNELTNSDGFVGLSVGTNAAVTSGQRDIVQGTSLSSFISSEAMLNRNQDEAYAAPVSFAPLETAVTALTEEDLKAIVAATPAELLGRAAGGQAAIEARRRAKEEAHSDGLNWLDRMNPELKNRYLLTQSYQRTGRPLARDAYIAANPPANKTYEEDLMQTPEYQHYVSIPSVNPFSDRADIRRAEAMMPVGDTDIMNTTERAERVMAYKTEQLEKVRNTPEFQRMREFKDQDFGTIATPDELADARDIVQKYHGVDPATIPDEERFKLEKAKALRKQHAINLMFDRYDNKSKALSLDARYARVKDFSEEHMSKREELRVQSDNTPEAQAYNNIRNRLIHFTRATGEEGYTIDAGSVDAIEEIMGVDKYDSDTVKQLEAMSAEYEEAKAKKDFKRRDEIKQQMHAKETELMPARYRRALEYVNVNLPILSAAAHGTKEHQAFINYPVYSNNPAGIARAEAVLGLSPQRSEPTEVLSPTATSTPASAEAPMTQEERIKRAANLEEEMFQKLLDSPENKEQREFFNDDALRTEEGLAAAERIMGVDKFYSGTKRPMSKQKRKDRAEQYANKKVVNTDEFRAWNGIPAVYTGMSEEDLIKAEEYLARTASKPEPVVAPPVPEADSPDVRLAKLFAETKQLHEERRKTDVSYIAPDDEAIMKQVQQIAINQLNETGISVPRQTPENASALAAEVKKIAEKDRQVTRKNKRKISAAQLKTARSTQSELYGKEEMTQDERQRLSAAQEILRVYGMQTVRKNFGDDTSQGIPQLYDILSSITPQDWDTSPEAMQRRGVAGSVASIVDSLDPSMLALAKNADFTTSRGRNWLGTKDPRWKAIIAQLDSIPDIKKYTRSRDRGLRGAVRADAMTSVSDAAAKSITDVAEDTGPAYFDLETNIPRNDAGEDDKSLKRTIFQASVLSGDQKEPTVMYAAASEEIAKQIEAMAAEANTTDDPTRRDEIIKQMHATATTDVYGKTGKDVDVNADVIQSLVTHALAGGAVYDQETIRDLVKSRIGDATQVVGHNVKEFDLPVLYDGGIDQAAIDTVPEDIMSKAVDTLALSRDISPGSHRLIDSYKRFVDPAGFAGAHDAGQDVLATRALHGVLGRRGVAMGKLDMSTIPAELHPYITDSSKVGAGDPRAKQFAVLTGTYKALSTMEDYTQKYGVEGQKMDARTMENMEKMFPGIGAITPENSAELKKQIQEQYLDRYQHLAVDGSFRSGSAFLQRRADFDKTKPYWGSYAGMRENLSRGLSIEDMVGAAAEGVGVHAKRVEGTAGTAAAAVAGGAAETRRTGSRMGSYGAGGTGGGGGSGGSFTMSGGGDVPGGGGGGPIIIHVGRAEIYVQNGHVAGTSEGGDGKWSGGSYTGGGTGMDAGVESTDKDPDTGGSFSAGVAGAGMGSRRTGPKDAYVDPAGSEASAGSSVSVGPISVASLDGVTTLSASAFTIQNATIQQVQTDTVTVQSTGGPVTVTAQFSKEGAAAYDKSLVYVKNTGDASIEGNVSMGGGRGGSGGPRFPASVTGTLSQMDYDRATTAAKLGTERDPALRASLQSDLMTRGYANMRGALNSEEFAGVRKLNVGGNNVGDLVELVTSIPELAVPELNATNVVAAAEQQHQAAITAGADEDTVAEYAAVVASARQFTEALRELNKAFQQTEQSSRTNAPYERGTDAKTGSTYTTDGLRKYNNEMAPYRGALNNIEVMRGYYTAQLSKEKDPVVAETLRAKMMSEFAGSAKGILGHSTFADVLGMDVGGISVQSALDRVQHDPVTGLGMLNYMAEGMTTQTGSALDALKASGTATEEEIKQAQARNNKAHEFVATLGEFSKAYRDVTYSQKTTPPYDRTAGAGGVGGVGVAGKRGGYDPGRQIIVDSLEAARSAYDQSGGLFSGKGIYQSKDYLTRRTIEAGKNLLAMRESSLATTSSVLGSIANPAASVQYADVQKGIASVSTASTIEQASAAMLQLLSSLETLTATLAGETGPGIDAFAEDLQGLGKLASTGTTQLNKTAKTQQQTESLQIGKMEERVQAAVTQPGIFNFGRRREDKKAALRDFAEGFLGDKADTLYDEKMGELSLPELTETVDATGKRVLSINPRGRRKSLQRASDKDLQRQVEYLNQLDPSNPVTFESLSKTQRAYARAQQSQNQAPFADKMFYAASKLRDLQFFAQGIAGIPQIPQQIMQTIEMATSPALNAERTMTTARSLSLTPQVYNAALSAAAGQQARFGGSLSSNVGKITDFIPLTNAYGVDMTKSLNVARKLAAFDPAQGMQGASIALKEFLSGNVSSLSRRFEINRSALSKINTGDATEMLDSLDNVLSSMGVTDKLIDDQANTMATKYDKMVGRLETIGQNLSTMLVSAVTPALESMLGSDSGVATSTGNKTLSKLTSESLQSYGDATFSNKVTGLDSLDPYADPAKFNKDLDNVLRMANNEIAVQARGYSSGTGLVPQLAPYRMMENASATQRFSMQHTVMKYLDQGMGKEQAYLQALRENQGDFNTSQEFLFQRNPINGLNMSAPNQYLGGLVKTKPGNLTLAGVLPKGPDLSTPEAQARIFGTYDTLGTMSAATPGGLDQQQIDIIGGIADKGLMLESMGANKAIPEKVGTLAASLPGSSMIPGVSQLAAFATNNVLKNMSTPDLAKLARKMGTAAYATVQRRLDNDTVELLDEYGKTFTARISNIDAPEHTAAAGNTSVPKNDVLGRSMGLTQADYVITQADRNEYLKQAQASGMSEAQAKKMIDSHGYDKTLIKVASQPKVLAVGDSKDRYERQLASLFTTDKNGNLVAVNRKMAELGGAPVAFSGLPEEARTAMDVLAKNAADTKLGAVNTQAAGLDLGGNAIISQQARDAYFQRHYLGMGGTVGMATGAAGAGILGLHLGGGAIMSAFPGSAAATAIGSAGAIGAGGVFGLAGGIGLAAGLGYAAYAYGADSSDTSVAKQRELYEIQAKMNTQENQRRRSMNYVYNAGLLPNTKRAIAAATTGGGEQFATQRGREVYEQGIAPQVDYTSIKNFTLDGFISSLLGNLPAGQTPKETDDRTQVALDMADEVSKEMEKTKDEFAKRRETAPDSVKKVYDRMVINPMDPGTAERPNYISVLDLQQTLTAIDTVAASSSNEQFQNYADTPEYVRARAAIANQTADPEKQKINDLLEKNKITIPRRILKGGPDYIRNRLTSAADAESFTFNTDDMLKYSATEQDNIYRYGLDQLGSLRNYSQPAKEYQDQAMGKMVGLRNQRFTSFMDANALNAMFMGSDNTTSPIGLRGTSGVKAAALNMLDQSYFIKNNAGDQGQINEVRSAQTQAVDAMLEQARAFKEQADMARPFTTLYKSTFANLIMGMNIAQENFQQIFDTMGQGNPLFAIDFAKQSTGLDWKQSIASQLYVPGFNQQGAENALRPGLMAGTFQVPYATGPRASIRYANDLLNDKQTTGMLNPAEMLNIFQSAAQGQTEIVRRQIQFNNQMRDLNTNHNRALEDIARNGMRQLEDIHINYTRQMIQLVQQNEISKRMDRASVNKNIESADITQADRVQAHVVQESGQMFARHAGQSNPQGFLARVQGTALENDPQVVALREALAKYNSISYDDSGAKQAAWDKVIEARNPLEGKIKQMMQGANPTDTANYESYLALLGRDPAREAAAQNYSNQRTSQFVETAAERKALLRQKEDLLRQQSGEGLTRRQLQKGLEEANASGDPLQIAAARKAMEDFDISSQRTAEAVALVSQKLSAISNTSEMFADAWTEAFANITNNASTTVLGLVQSLDDFNKTMQRQLDDQQLQFNRQIFDLKQAFIDAAREIATQVPGEMAKGYTAVMTYMAEQSRAEATMLGGNYEDGKDQMFANMNRLGDALYGTPDSDAKKVFLANLKKNIPASDKTATGVELPSNGITAALAKVNGKWALRVTGVWGEEDKPDKKAERKELGGNGLFSE